MRATPGERALCSGRPEVGQELLTVGLGRIYDGDHV